MALKWILGDFKTGIVTMTDLPVTRGGSVTTDLYEEGTADIEIAIDGLTENIASNWRSTFKPIERFVALHDDSVPYSTFGGIVFFGFINKISIDAKRDVIKLQAIEIADYLKVRILAEPTANPNAKYTFTGNNWGSIQAQIIAKAFDQTVSSYAKPPSYVSIPSYSTTPTRTKDILFTDVLSAWDTLDEVRTDDSGVGQEWTFRPIFSSSAKNAITLHATFGSPHYQESSEITIDVSASTAKLSSYRATIDSTSVFNRLFIQSKAGDEEAGTGADLIAGAHPSGLSVLVDSNYYPNVELTPTELSAQLDAHLINSQEEGSEVTCTIEEVTDYATWVSRLGYTVSITGDDTVSGSSFRLMSITVTPGTGTISLGLVQKQAVYPRLPARKNKSVYKEPKTQKPPKYRTPKDKPQPPIIPPTPEPPVIPPTVPTVPEDVTTFEPGQGQVPDAIYGLKISDVQVHDSFMQKGVHLPDDKTLLDYRGTGYDLIAGAGATFGQGELGYDIYSAHFESSFSTATNTTDRADRRGNVIQYNITNNNGVFSIPSSQESFSLVICSGRLKDGHILDFARRGEFEIDFNNLERIFINNQENSHKESINIYSILSNRNILTFDICVNGIFTRGNRLVIGLQATLSRTNNSTSGIGSLVIQRFVEINRSDWDELKFDVATINSAYVNSSVIQNDGATVHPYMVIKGGNRLYPTGNYTWNGSVDKRNAEWVKYFHFNAKSQVTRSGKVGPFGVYTVESSGSIKRATNSGSETSGLYRNTAFCYNTPIGSTTFDPNSFQIIDRWFCKRLPFDPTVSHFLPVASESADHIRVLNYDGTPNTSSFATYPTLFNTNTIQRGDVMTIETVPVEVLVGCNTSKNEFYLILNYLKRAFIGYQGSQFNWVQWQSIEPDYVKISPISGVSTVPGLSYAVKSTEIISTELTKFMENRLNRSGGQIVTKLVSDGSNFNSPIAPPIRSFYYEGYLYIIHQYAEPEVAPRGYVSAKIKTVKTPLLPGVDGNKGAISVN